MKIINFDERFQQYTVSWMEQNAAKYKNNLDRMEEQMPEVYLQWLNTPADWLEGATPGAYFAQYTDAQALADWMIAYFKQGTPVPDQLLERLVDLGGAAEAALLAVTQDTAMPKEARLTAITLLSEMESTQPLALYVQWIAARAAQDDLAEVASDALVAMGRVVVAPILLQVDAATEAGRETFLDILCNFPGEEAIYTLALGMFQKEAAKRALYASLLGKLGDDRAIPVLREAMTDDELNYLDYIELRNAIEALGGEVPDERVFDGDPYYESMRTMD